MKQSRNVPLVMALCKAQRIAPPLAQLALRKIRGAASTLLMHLFQPIPSVFAPEL